MPDEQRRRDHSVGAALSEATSALTAAGVPSPRVDAALLLEAVTGFTRTEQLVRRGEQLTPEAWDRLTGLLQRRVSREPLQHVVGEAQFLDMRLAVAPGVLVPRPETERLVDLVLTELMAGSLAGRGGNLALDVGTGTGAIALALKAAIPGLEVWATDVSEAALELARANARRLGLELRLRRSDLLSDPEVADVASRAAAVVSNPPYLPDSDRTTVAPEVAVEPEQALYAGPEGLDVARRLVAQSFATLQPEALLALELDPRNVSVLAEEMKHAGFGSVRVEPDLAGRDRFLLARR